MRILNHLKPEASVALVIPTPSTEDEAISKKKISHLLMTSKMQTILLNKLSANGISLDDCSVLTFSQIRHPQVDTMTNDEFRCWQELLRRDLEKLPNCKLIISVGEMPLRALANVANISKYQGAPIDCTLAANKLVLPIDSYTFAMGNPDWFPLTDFFLQKASRYKSMTTKPWKTINTIVTKDDILLEQEFLHTDYEWLAFDIECSQYEMTCIGFAKDERTAYVIPLVHCYGNRLGRLLQIIQRILARQDTKKLAQNGNFDITYLAYHYKISVANFAWDTMLAMHSMFPNLPKDLGTLNAIFADEPYWKDDGKQWQLSYDKVNWSQFFEYNGRDTANLLTIRASQEQLLRARGTEATFQQEMALCKPLIFMELIGVDIDKSKQQELEAEAMRNIACWELYLQTILGNLACNVRSPKQLLKLLYTDLKLPKRVRDSKLSTDIDALVSLIPFAPEIIKPIIILKSWLKENSEYKVKTNDDGKMRTTFKPGGTLTGRLSSSKSITGSGTNFQNRSKKLRQYFVPDRQKNEIMIQADYSKAESWVVACLAQDMKMLEALYGEDFHSTNASNILGKPVTKANYDDRQLGKRISHACWTGEAEVLTPSGWLRLDQLDDTTEIAVWDKDTNGIHFERPSHMTRANYSGKLHALNGTSYSHLVTPNHRMIFHTYDKQWRIEEASEFVKRKSARLPIAGVKVDSSHFIDEAMLALAIAIQADGRLQCGKVRFRFKKERKISRLLYWLKDIKYTSVIDNDQVTNIYINQSDIAPAMEMLNSNKTFNWEKFLSLPASLMTFVCNEVIHWDGNDSNDGRNRLTYCSTIKSNVELIQTLAHLTGYQALLRKSSAVGKQDLYTVSFNARQLARLESMAISTIDYTGQVYCPTVSTGAFLVRRKDKIQISMNSNYGMTAFLLQSVLLRDGYNYSISQCQEFIESYFMTYPKIRSNYHQWVQDELRRDRTLTNAFGRKITFWEPWGNSLFNAAYAWIPQGTVGDMTNKALINIYETIPEVALKIQVHDSIVMTTDQDNLNQDLIDKITSCMVMPLTIKGITINIPIDIEVGYNWYNLTDWNKFKEAI